MGRSGPRENRVHRRPDRVHRVPGGVIRRVEDRRAGVSKATETIHGHDAAIMIKLFRHMANELERADPQAAKIVAAMKKINLPPIEYRRTK